MITTVSKRHTKVTIPMDNMLLFGLVLITTIGTSYSQSCPEIPNVARVCTTATYSGARVLMDTSYYTETVQNCSCSFSTTADTIRIVTYAAPNYQECNSAIRFYSDSGNTMRFQCLMSGTYLDTSIYKDGGADFETYGPQYDKNYCLVLEHLGTSNDSITITCQGNDSSGTVNATDVFSSNEDIITTPSPADMATSNVTDGNSVNGTNTNRVEPTSLETIENASTKNTGLNNVSVELSAESNSVQGNTNGIASINTTNDTRPTEDINLITNMPTATTVEPDTVKNTILLQGNTTADTRSLDILSVRNGSNMLSQNKELTTDLPMGTTIITAANEANTTNITKALPTLVLREKHSDILTFDTITRENATAINESSPDIIHFGNDAIPKDEYISQTTTNNPGKHWTDAVVVRNITATSDVGISFGNDAIAKENVNSKPDVFTTEKRMTFGNDAIVKDTNSYETTTSIQQDKSLSHSGITEPSIIAERFETVTNTNINNANTNVSYIDTITGGEGGSFSTRNESTTVSNTPSYANDVTEQYAHTFGPDIVSKERATFGQDAIPFEHSVESRIPFGSDEHISHDLVNDTNAVKLLGASEVTIENSTIDPYFESGLDKQTFGIDAIPKGRTTSASKNSDATLQTTTKGTETLVLHDRSRDTIAFDHTMKNDVKTTEAYLWTTGRMPTERVTFGNDAISRENFTTVDNNRAFGVDAVVPNTNVIMTDTVGEVEKTNDTITTWSDSFTTEKIPTFGNDAIPKEAMARSDVTPTPGVSTTGQNGTIEVDAFGNDVVIKETNTTLSKDLSETPILSINTMTGERATFGGNDAISKTVSNGQTTTSSPHLFGGDATDPRMPFGDDAISKDGFISNSGGLNADQSTFGIDAIPKETSSTDAFPRETFGNDAISKETNPPRNIETLVLSEITRNIIIDSRRDGENTTEPMEWATMGIISDRATFGNDAITRHRATSELQAVTTEKTTFGNDAIAKNGIGSQSTVPSVEKSTFGNDAISLVGGFENETIINDVNVTIGKDTHLSRHSPIDAIHFDKATFGNDTIPKKMLSTDAIPKEIFANDAISKEPNPTRNIETLALSNRPIDTIIDGRRDGENTTEPMEWATQGIIGDRATFGNDAITRHRATSGLQSVTTEKTTFGNDAIANIGITSIDKSPFENDAIPLVSGFGNDVIIEDAHVTMVKDTNLLSQRPIDTISFDKAMFGNDAVSKDVVTTQPEVASTERRTSFGNDAVTKGNDMSILDARSRDMITFDSITSNTVISTDEPVWATNTMASDRARFGNDAIMKEPDFIMNLGNEVTEKPIVEVTFGNDAIQKESFSENAAVSDANRTVISSLLLSNIPRDTIMPEPNAAGTFTTTESSLITNMLSSENTTFGNDAIPKEMQSNTNSKSIVASEFSSDNSTREKIIDFANDVALKETVARGIHLDSLQINETVPSLATDIITERRQTFGDDIVMKSDSLVRSTFGSDVVSKNIRTTTGSKVMETNMVDNALLVLGNMMNSHDTGTFINSHDVLVSDTHLPVNNVISEHNITEAILVNDDTITTTSTTTATPPPPPPTEIPVNEPVIEEVFTKEIDSSLQTFGDDIVMKSDSLVRSTFGSDVVSKNIRTTTDSKVMETNMVDNALLVLGNMMNSHDTGTFINSHDVLVSDTHLPVNNVISEHNITEAILVNDDTITTTSTTTATPPPPPPTEIPVNESVIGEVFSKEIDSSLLNRFNQVKPENSNNLMDSIFNTHMDTVSSFDTNPLNSIMGKDSFDRAPIGQDTVTRNIISDIDNRSIELTNVSSDITTDILNDNPNLDVVAPKSERTMSTITDYILTEESASTTPQLLSESPLAEERARTTPQLLSEPTSTTSVLTSSTKTIRVTPTTTDVVKTQSTLPDIIPTDTELIEPIAPRQEIGPIVKAVPTTQKPIRTTKKVYAVMVDEAAVINRQTIVDDSSNTRTSKDQLNVSFDDEPNNSLFETNNKTNIIIVIAAAGTVMLITVIAVIICNRRKGRSAKAELNNGVSASNHNNAAFDNDVSEAERGNALSNGVDLQKPTVEVIEPSANGIDSKIPGGS